MTTIRAQCPTCSQIQTLSFEGSVTFYCHYCNQMGAIWYDKKGILKFDGYVQPSPDCPVAGS